MKIVNKAMNDFIQGKRGGLFLHWTKDKAQKLPRFFKRQMLVGYLRVNR